MMMMSPLYLPVLPALLSLITTSVSSNPDDYVYQWKCPCYYRNGTEDVRFLQRYFYNQEEIVYFDSDVGHYIAKTELGRPEAEAWNNNPDILAQMRAEVETVCKHNYPYTKGPVMDRKVEPKLKIIYTPSAMPEFENILTCIVYSFYPHMINVTWLRNGVEESEQVTSSDLLNDGDWTNQIHVNLETPVKHGDTFTCRVEHSSLTAPMEVDWKYETSDSARNKKLTGIVGFVLGAVFFIVGLVVFLHNKKGVEFLAVQQDNPLR